MGCVLTNPKKQLEAVEYIYDEQYYNCKNASVIRLSSYFNRRPPIKHRLRILTFGETKMNTSRHRRWNWHMHVSNEAAPASCCLTAVTKTRDGGKHQRRHKTGFRTSLALNDRRPVVRITKKKMSPMKGWANDS